MPLTRVIGVTESNGWTVYEWRKKSCGHVRQGRFDELTWRFPQPQFKYRYAARRGSVYPMAWLQDDGRRWLTVTYLYHQGRTREHGNKNTWFVSNGNLERDRYNYSFSIVRCVYRVPVQYKVVLFLWRSQCIWPPNVRRIVCTGRTINTYYGWILNVIVYRISGNRRFRTV